MANLPIDFVEKVQAPPSVSGGYPYRISASDLMQNFHAASLEVDQTTHESGLRLEEKTGPIGSGYQGRIVSLAGQLTGGSGWWGTLLFSHYLAYPDVDSAIELNLTIEDGRIVAVSSKELGGTLESRAGTEASPGMAAFNSWTDP